MTNAQSHSGEIEMSKQACERCGVYPGFRHWSDCPLHGPADGKPYEPLVTRPEWNGGACPTCKVEHPFDNVFCSDGYHLGEHQ